MATRPDARRRLHDDREQLPGEAHYDADARHRGYAAREQHAPAPLAYSIGRTRYFVLVAVVAVLAVSLALFVAAGVQAAFAIWHAMEAGTRGELSSTALTVEFLEIVGAMLKAVVFYIVGVGLYSLFITPLNLPAALGVESFGDLEARIVSVVIVIMTLTFLEHFITWENPAELVQFGGTMAVVIVALVLFQFHISHARQAQKRQDAATEVRAQRSLFQQDEEERQVLPEDALSTEAANPEKPVDDRSRDAQR